MTAQMLSMTSTLTTQATSRTAISARLTRLRSRAAEGLGWTAYGLFYVTVLATLIGLPVGFAFYLVDLQN